MRTFSIPLDDVSYTTWNCAADKTKFGTGGGAAGQAQAYLLGQVQKGFIDTHPGASRLEMVPTEYSDLSVIPHKTAIKNDLSSKIVVGWTGVGVIAPTITTVQAKQANDVFGHDILLWDNYPVNDYVTDRLLLGPYVGREAGLDLYGITANPMIQPEASKIALFNVADYSWNGGAYDPQASWQASLTELAGGNAQARTALAAFADLEYSSRIDTTQAPALAKQIKAFWSAFNSDQTDADQTDADQADAAALLDDYLKVIEAIPTTLADQLNDPEFVSEAKPWLDSAGYWGQSARAALRMLVDARAGNGAAVVADRADAIASMAKAKTFQYKGLGGTVNVTVGDGVIDTFITDALSLNDRWLGLAGRHVTAITSLPTYQTNVPANMVDGNDSTFFWSSAAPAIGDYVGVDLGTVQPISTVSVQMSKPSSPSDYLHGAELEYSSNGSTWTGVGSFVNQTNINATLPSGVQARYVRLRNTGSQSNWVVVREFTVTGPDNTRLTVSGSPAAAVAALGLFKVGVDLKGHPSAGRVASASERIETPHAGLLGK
ncbi:MAG TPA: beta-N-acetylglucosaminidase domain-containing protein [Microbacteriaceae bacterium]